MTDTQVEAVAKALYEHGTKGPIVPFAIQSLGCRELYESMARAAIAALDIEKIEREAYERGIRDAEQSAINSIVATGGFEP